MASNNRDRETGDRSRRRAGSREAMPSMNTATARSDTHTSRAGICLHPICSGLSILAREENFFGHHPLETILHQTIASCNQQADRQHHGDMGQRG